MFTPGQVVTWKVEDTWLNDSKSYYAGQYGYVLYEDKDDKGTWHVMMMKKDSDTLHKEHIHGDYLKSAEDIK